MSLVRVRDGGELVTSQHAVATDCAIQGQPCAYCAPNIPPMRYTVTIAGMVPRCLNGVGQPFGSPLADPNGTYVLTQDAVNPCYYHWESLTTCTGGFGTPTAIQAVALMIGRGPTFQVGSGVECLAPSGGCFGATSLPADCNLPVLSGPCNVTLSGTSGACSLTITPGP